MKPPSLLSSTGVVTTLLAPFVPPNAPEDEGKTRGAFPLEHSGSDDAGALPFPYTTSAKEGDGKELGKRPDTGEQPSGEEGLKSSHSSSSSPVAQDDDGENGETLG
jgi:hypothetical protein